MRPKLQLGETFEMDGKTVSILEIVKGTKNTQPCFQGGIHTGFKSSAKKYRLSNGELIKGSTIIKRTTI